MHYSGIFSKARNGICGMLLECHCNGKHIPQRMFPVSPWLMTWPKHSHITATATLSLSSLYIDGGIGINYGCGMVVQWPSFNQCKILCSSMMMWLVPAWRTAKWIRLLSADWMASPQEQHNTSAAVSSNPPPTTTPTKK